MRIPKLFPILVTGGLLLAAGLFAAAPGVSAQSFGYGKLTPAQKAHVSGLLSVELGGRGMRTATPARSSLTTVTPPGCDVNLGSNIKVNQNCLNITDSDLQGRGQAQNETYVAVDPLNSRNIVAGYNDYRRGDSTCGVSYSANGGAAWADATIPDGFVRGTAFGGTPREYFQASGDPSVAWDTRGNAYYTCLEFKRGAGVTEDADQSSAFYLYRSTGTDGASWNFTGRPVAEHNDVAGAGDFLLDKPLMAVDDSTTSPFRDRIYVAYTAFAADGTAYIYEAYSADYGEHFSAPVLVSTNSSLCPRPASATHPLGTCDNNQFAQPFTAPDGTVYVVFDNYNSARSGAADNHSQVLLARSADGGASFSAPVKVGDFYDLPDCATYQGGADAGSACVPEKGATAASIFRAANYPYGAVDPRHPGTIAVTYGSYINRNSTEANGCVPAGVNPATLQNLYTGVKTPGACHNAIVLSVSVQRRGQFHRHQPGCPVAPGRRVHRRPDQHRPVLPRHGLQLLRQAGGRRLRPLLRHRRDHRLLRYLGADVGEPQIVQQEPAGDHGEHAARDRVRRNLLRRLRPARGGRQDRAPSLVRHPPPGPVPVPGYRDTGQPAASVHRRRGELQPRQRPGHLHRGRTRALTFPPPTDRDRRPAKEAGRRSRK